MTHTRFLRSPTGELINFLIEIFVHTRLQGEGYPVPDIFWRRKVGFKIKI